MRCVNEDSGRKGFGAKKEERLKIYLDLRVICTQTTVDNILNKQALETSYSSNTPFMSKEMWTNNDLASALLMVSGEWPVASIANTELRGV